MHFPAVRSNLRVLLARLILLPLLFVGCGPANPPPVEKATPQIALIMKSLANEFFSTMADGARTHQQAHPQQYDLIINGIKDERDLGRQIALVDEMIARQVDAIVIAPADSKALSSVLSRAQQAGIIVVNIDNKLDQQVLDRARMRVPFVGPDNRAGAQMVGQHLAKHLSPGDTVAILEGVRSAYNAQQRRQGFQDAMKAAGIEIVDSQSAQWEMDQANKIASAMISEHPNLKALLCSNDSMALGALAAVKAAGRAGEITIVGFDNISAIQEAIKEGTVLATADQHADQLAVYGIEYALQLIEGAVAPQDLQTPVDLITAESLR